MEIVNKFAHPVARVLMGAFFLMAGIGKIAGVAGFAGFIESKLPGLGVLAWPAIIFEIVAGACILVGFKTRIVALLLAGFCVFTGVVFHGFADMQGAVMFKNIALAGGYLMLAAYGAGKYAVDK